MDHRLKEIRRLARAAKEKRAQADVLRGKAADDLGLALDMARESGYMTAAELAQLAGMSRVNLYDVVRRRRGKG